MFLLLSLQGFLSVVYTYVCVNKRVTKEIFRRTFQISALEGGLVGWKMKENGPAFEDYSAAMVQKFSPEILQDPD